MTKGPQLSKLIQNNDFKVLSKISYNLQFRSSKYEHKVLNNSQDTVLGIQGNHTHRFCLKLNGIKRKYTNVGF